MPSTADTLAQKQRKQKIMLVVGGVAFAGLVALQAPKLLGGGSSSTTDETAGPVRPTPGAVVEPVPSQSTTGPPRAGTAQLAGVTIAPSGEPQPAPGQLASFTLFAPKDPFEPGVADEELELVGGAADAAARGAGPAKPGESSPASEGSATKSGAETTAPAGEAEAAQAEAPRTAATLSVNGKAQQLQLKDRFPKAEKLFVLASLGPTSAKIAVADGGSFSSGRTITLTMGKPLTLVNEATGARYKLRLLYTGDQPERIAGFKSTAK